MATAHVLDVGNCDPDHGTISRMLHERFDVAIDRVMFVTEALEKLNERGDYDLVLVNRLIFADGSPGIDLVHQMQRDEQLKNIPIMLISNFEEAQDQATEAGAERGFGKNSVFEETTTQMLSKFLSRKN